MRIKAQSLTLTSPDGGIGRRAGLKHQWSNPCRFDPGSGYPTKCKCLKIKHLHFSFSHLHHACTTKSAFSGQNRYFSKNFSVWPVSFACLDAKLVKVGVNDKKEASQKLFEQNKYEYNSCHQRLQNNLQRLPINPHLFFIQLIHLTLTLIFYIRENSIAFHHSPI